MKKVKVKLLNNSYPVFIGRNILKTALLKYDWKNISKVLVITDSNVAPIYGKQVLNLFKVLKIEAYIFVIKAGEESKSFKVLNSIYSFMMIKGFGRDSFIAALGGGVVGDISGYAASTYMRGIKYCQIPTTLLASVDSSVGGKTGINFNGTKNIIGSFYQPQFVISDLAFINSLPKEELICGLGEVLKYCFLSDYNFFSYLKKHYEKIWNKELTAIEKIVTESIKIKSSVVSIDEKENGIRKILNLGHTFAHGFESILNYKIKHGEAVIAGIGCSIVLSHKAGFLNIEKVNEFFELINYFPICLNINRIDKQKLYEIMLKDKKNKSGKIKFVLLSDIGRIIVDSEATYKDVIDSINKFNQLYKVSNR